MRKIMMCQMQMYMYMMDMYALCVHTLRRGPV